MLAFQGAKVVNLFVMAKCLCLNFLDWPKESLQSRAGQSLSALRAAICKKLADIGSFFYLHPAKKLADIKYFLFNIEYQSFQVLAFGVVYVYRVVGRLCQLVQNAHIALCHCRCSEHCCAEVLFADYLRA